MGTKKRVGPLSSTAVDMNSNQEKEEEFFLYDLINIGIKSGRMFFFGTSYSIIQSNLSGSEFKFTVKNHLRQKIFLRILHALFFFYLIALFFTEQIYTKSPCALVNMIKKGLHVVVVFCLFVTFYCVETKGSRTSDGMIPIFEQCIFLQNKFKAIGIRFPARSKMKAFAWSISIAACACCVLRQYLFATKMDPWYPKYARALSKAVTLGFWVADNSTSSDSVVLMFGSFGVVLDGLVANYWFFGQVIHFFFVATMWLVFYKLNKAWESGHFHTKHLPDVIDLHFQSTKLLKAINQLIAPLIFWSVVYDIVCLCFWTNYMALNFKIRTHYIAAVCNFVKTALELFMEADVNSKAHLIADWLEESCTAAEKFPQMDPVKLAIFTSQVYNKDSTGFRGLSFFVVTPRLAISIVGIVIMYSVAVNQLCHS